MILADTSVWIEFARRGSSGRAAALGSLLDDGEIVTCGPVVAELLAGAEGKVAEQLAVTLRSLPWAELDPDAWPTVGTVASALRREGMTLPLTDLVIAVAAARSSHSVWTFDADFERIAIALEALELFVP